MFRRSIPEDELASLSEAVRNVIQNPAIFEYRQYELDQAPSPEIVKQAQEIWDLACALKEGLDNRDPKQAKQKIGELGLVLNRVREKDYSHLLPVIQKAKGIVDIGKELIAHDPDFIALARKDEILTILASCPIKLGKNDLDDIVEDADNREKIVLSDKRNFLHKIFSSRSSTVLPLNPLQTLSSVFDNCLDEAYKRFSKTKLGEYVKKYQVLADKFRQARKWREKEIVKLRTELGELRKKLLPEDQKKLETQQVSEKTRLELLIALLPNEEYNRFMSHLKRSTKLDAKNVHTAKFQ